jgi:hypothetical protein
LVNFQRDVLRIFAEHRKLRNDVYSTTTVSAEMYQHIKVTFLALKATFNAINTKELAINGMLQAEILQITMTIEKECFRRFIKMKMERDQGTYEAFRRINVDS